VRYRFIDEAKGDYPINLLCRVMRVSRSAYHAHASGKTYVLSPAKAELSKHVEQVFWAHRRRYGSRRIGAELVAQGKSVGRFQVRSLMRRQSLHAIAPKRFRPQTTDSRHTVQASPNLLLDAENAVQKPGEVIIGDITYLPMRSGKWSYLASWQDKFTRRIVGWAVADSMTEELVTKAFAGAVGSGSIKAQTIIHTDRGSQYVSNNFRAMLEANECRQSMSRRANCCGVPKRAARLGFPVGITRKPRVYFQDIKPSYSKTARLKTRRKPKAKPLLTSKVITTGCDGTQV
jgi:transposase InsO family protein